MGPTRDVSWAGGAGAGEAGCSFSGPIGALVAWERVKSGISSAQSQLLNPNAAWPPQGFLDRSLGVPGENPGKAIRACTGTYISGPLGGSLWGRKDRAQGWRGRLQSGP